MDFKRLIKSFRCAFHGFWDLLHTQQNSRIHAVAAIVVIILGVLFQIQPLEWALVLFVSAFVFAMEQINTVVERMLDVLHPDDHPGIGHAKDMMAGSVLFAALAAVVIGLIVFLPYVVRLIIK
jgi:undecaprenol kinase